MENQAQDACKDGGKPGTRRQSQIFGLGAKITIEDAEITGLRLPTNEQVLRCFKYHQMQRLAENFTKRDIAKIVLEKIVPFYHKANIPMISSKRVCEKIIALVDRNAKLRETPIERRSSPAIIAKLEGNRSSFQQTFPFGRRMLKH